MKGFGGMRIAAGGVACRIGYPLLGIEVRRLLSVERLHWSLVDT